MVVDHALGIAGRARGVAERDRIPLVAAGSARRTRDRPRRAAPRSRRAEASPRAARVDDVDHERRAPASAPAPPRPPARIACRRAGPGLAVLEDEGDRAASRRVLSAFSTAPASARHNAPRASAACWAHHRHRVAAADPGPRSARREPAAARMQLRVGKAPGAVDHGDAAGRPTARSQEIERGQGA